MNKKNLLTKKGKIAFEKELDYLLNVVRPENQEAIKTARELGDLSENADYAAARAKQGEIESRIAFLQNLLDNAEIIEVDGRDVVTLGAEVIIKDLDTESVEKYEIVSGIEIKDYSENKISIDSPLAKAILEHKVGDIVTVKAKVDYDVEIIEIIKKL